MNVYDRNKKITQTHTEMVLVDVVGFSKLTSQQQVTAAVVINAELESLIQLMSGQSALKIEEVVAGFVPTGDGFYVVLQPNISGYGLSLAVSLRSALLVASNRSKKNGTGYLYDGIRVACHFGEICEFSDITEKDNFVGHGMNECARISGAKYSDAPEGFLEDENFIVASEASIAAHDALYVSDEAIEYFTNLGLRRSESCEITDKHGFVHKFCFVEISRNIALNPPKPTNFEERVRKQLEKYIGKNEG